MVVAFDVRFCARFLPSLSRARHAPGVVREVRQSGPVSPARGRSFPCRARNPLTIGRAAKIKALVISDAVSRLIQFRLTDVGAGNSLWHVDAWYSLLTSSHAVFLFIAMRRVACLAESKREVFVRHSTNQNQALLSINTSKESLENYSILPPGVLVGRRVQRQYTAAREPGIIRSSLLASRAHRIGKWVDRTAPPSILARRRRRFP